MNNIIEWVAKQLANYRSPQEILLSRRENTSARHQGEYRPALRPRRRHVGVWIFRTLAAFVLTILTAIAAAGLGLAIWVWGPWPAQLDQPLPDLPNPQGSVVVDADGTLLAEFNPIEQYQPLRTDDMPFAAVTAVIAAEDQRFYTHKGVDPQGLLRAALVNYRAGEITQGGSTLTQQLVKLRSGDNERTIDRKIREAVEAIRLERATSKAEIVAAYLNTAYFGDSAIGIEAAARQFFGIPASELSLSEAALIAGALPAPSAFNARNDPAGAEVRRIIVLNIAEEAGLITTADADAARAEIPVLFRRQTATVKYPYFVDYVRWWLVNEFGVTDEALFTEGLVIQATLDPELQAAAELAAWSTVTNPEGPEVSITAVVPQTGAIVAMVSGRDYDLSQVNLATGYAGGGTGRQPGSSFKPFVLAEALNQGRTLNSTIASPATVQPPGFTRPVGNYSPRGYGQLTLAAATRASVNTSFINLITETGVRPVVELVNEMGIETIDPETANGSIAIGTAEVSPLQMAAAYSVFANQGVKHKATPVSRILAKNGTVIFDMKANRGSRVLQPSVANDVSRALEEVVQDGTARRAQIEGRPVAGKTGTTQNYVDAWFVGYATQLSTAVWVGYPQGQIPLRNVDGVGQVTGGSLPAMAWQKFMSTALQDQPVLGLYDAVSAADLDLVRRLEKYDGVAPKDKRQLVSPPAGWKSPRPPVTTTTTTRPPPTTTTRPPPPTTTTTTTTPSTTTTTMDPSVFPDNKPTTTTTVPVATTLATTTTTQPPSEATTTTQSTQAPQQP